MRRSLLHMTTVVAITGALCGPMTAFASPSVLTPAEAVDLALSGDRDAVDIMVTGEAIGDVLSAPDGQRWVNILGEGVAVGLVVDAADAEKIPLLGRYGVRGATVRAQGTLHRACAEHGGDLDIHVATFEVFDEGETLERPLHPRKLGLAGAAIFVALALYWRYRMLRHRLQVG